jgi:hypothetical protein
MSHVFILAMQPIGSTAQSNSQDSILQRAVAKRAPRALTTRQPAAAWLFTVTTSLLARVAYKASPSTACTCNSYLHVRTGPCAGCPLGRQLSAGAPALQAAGQRHCHEPAAAAVAPPTRWVLLTHQHGSDLPMASLVQTAVAGWTCCCNGPWIVMRACCGWARH